MTRRTFPFGQLSLTARVGLALFILLLCLAGGASLAAGHTSSRLTLFLSMLGGGALLAGLLMSRLLGPPRRTLRALAEGVSNLEEGDYSLHLAETSSDELAKLVQTYNRLGNLLREERREIYQKELMLDTVLQTTPTSVVLTNPRHRVVFANRAAQRLLHPGGRLEGLDFSQILQGCPAGMRELLEGPNDSLFTTEGELEQEIYHLSRRTFHLNAQRHTLYMIRRLTRELSRQEVEVWKKAIRILNHELNNSLAPVASMIHSSRILISGSAQAERLGEVFDAITDRLDYLREFLESYARFARLPSPRKEEVDWQAFINGLRPLYSFRLEGPLPDVKGWFDPQQLQQVLINLFKNALEADPGREEPSLRVELLPDGSSRFLVMDRGPGMSEEVMRQALLPFYSTKQTGTGLGLPLCREILEAHGGRLQLQNRDGGGTTVACLLPPR